MTSELKLVQNYTDYIFLFPRYNYLPISLLLELFLIFIEATLCECTFTMSFFLVISFGNMQLQKIFKHILGTSTELESWRGSNPNLLGLG